MNATKTEIDPGWQWEKSIFGIHSNGHRSMARLTEQAAYQNARSLQGRLLWDPSCPTTTTGLELYNCVQSYLAPELAPRLLFYCAIGTALDYWYNIDGWFELNNVVVPIDLKVSPNGDRQRRVDVILVTMRECNGFRLWRTGKLIANVLTNHLRALQ
jgi:hypothetical protein